MTKGGSHKKTSIPDSSGDLDAPRTDLLETLAQTVENTGLGDTRVQDVLRAKSPMDAIQQTITHPVVLAIVVGVVILATTRR